MKEQKDLFDWQSSGQVVLFPYRYRIGRIRTTAEKMANRQSAKQQAWYRNQVDDGIETQMRALGFCSARIDREIAEFWQRVELRQFAIEKQAVQRET